MRLRPPSWRDEYEGKWYNDDVMYIERDYDDYIYETKKYSTNTNTISVAKPSYTVYNVPTVPNVDRVVATPKKEKTPLDWLFNQVEETCKLARLA